jgi:hypothetical protein
MQNKITVTHRRDWIFRCACMAHNWVSVTEELCSSMDELEAALLAHVNAEHPDEEFVWRLDSGWMSLGSGGKVTKLEEITGYNDDVLPMFEPFFHATALNSIDWQRLRNDDPGESAEEEPCPVSDAP